MDGLEKRRVESLRVEVRGGVETERAGDSTAQIGENIAEEVGTNDDVEILWASDKVHAEGIDVLLLVLDVRVVWRNLLQDLVLFMQPAN